MTSFCGSDNDENDYETGRREERAAVVAWLHRLGALDKSGALRGVAGLADSIDASIHLAAVDSVSVSPVVGALDGEVDSERQREGEDLSPVLGKGVDVPLQQPGGDAPRVAGFAGEVKLDRVEVGHTASIEATDGNRKENRPRAAIPCTCPTPALHEIHCAYLLACAPYGRCAKCRKALTLPPSFPGIGPSTCGECWRAAQRPSEPWSVCPHFPNDDMMRRRCACWDWPDGRQRTNEAKPDLVFSQDLPGAKPAPRVSVRWRLRQVAKGTLDADREAEAMGNEIAALVEWARDAGPVRVPPPTERPDGEVERVHKAIEAWADKMRERGVEKLYETGARYHLALTIRDLLADERGQRSETAVVCSRCVGWETHHAVMAARQETRTDTFEAAAKICDGKGDRMFDVKEDPAVARWCAEMIRRLAFADRER